MIELKNVTKVYSGKKALHDVNLTIGSGEIVGLFGENGAGKTTLFKAILGLISYDGAITLDGAPIGSANIARLSFATCEHSFFPRLSADENAAFYEEQFPHFNRKRYEALMQFFELPGKKRVGSLSVGQQNQVEVILALSQGADYILMDEPFAGNDVFNREDFYKVLLGLLEPHETVFLSTHLIEEVQNFVGRAVLIRAGEVIADVSADTLEEQGLTLMEFVKQSYGYREGRVAEALDKLTDAE